MTFFSIYFLFSILLLSIHWITIPWLGLAFKFASFIPIHHQNVSQVSAVPTPAMPMVASSVGAAHRTHPDAPSSLMEGGEKYFSQAVLSLAMQQVSYKVAALCCPWLWTPEMSQSFETRKMQIARAAQVPGTGLKAVGYHSLPSTRRHFLPTSSS